MEETYLADVTQQVRDWDFNRGRSQQKQVGWSGMADCRASIGFKIQGAWETNDTDDWRAIAGTGLHELLTEIRRKAVAETNEEVLWDVQTEYGGIPGHADEVSITGQAVTDYKFPSMKSLFVWDDPEVLEEKFVQPHGYAAGLVAAGILPAEGTIVRLLVAPVDGTFADWRLFERPFDQAVADAAVQRYRNVQEMVAAGDPPPRDKQWWWCERFCEFFDLCRGGEVPPDLPEITDPETAAMVERYGLAVEAASAAEKVKKLLAPALDGVRGTARGWQITRDRPGRRVDMDQVKADYVNSGEELPMKPQRGSLRVRRIKDGGETKDGNEKAAQEVNPEPQAHVTE